MSMDIWHPMQSIVNCGFPLTALPEVQKKVQHELDALLTEGDHIRLPTASDAEHLPYLKAVIKEIQRSALVSFKLPPLSQVYCRWQPVAPIGVPHLSTEDYVHDGYFIPKGSSSRTFGMSCRFQTSEFSH